ncbi:MAG: sigma-70 family RNA polymerase sigma factor [Proteobacteria bacterium]|nr:sigma-70 family RNA polymerase sigma factor [Pseudomonadota bacterium]MBS0566010.1 sigma-70 family RNA polymerase sigma factor [Pseudomonadota bacterium]
MTATDNQARTRRTIDALWRMESAKVVAVLARMLGGDISLAEELAQDALVTALEQWPDKGIPDNPGAWLMATAKNRAIDRLRHGKLAEEKHAQIARELDEQQQARAEDHIAALDDDIGDDLLRLMFTACHPALSREAQVALTLRLLGGLTTEEIARAFLVPEPTIAQRIVRAKRTLAEANVAFELPRGEDRASRLASVLDVIYLVFNEGYAATAGEDWMRPALCEEALRLGRILAELAPHDAEVHGLVALMEIQASRLHARSDKDGTPILLLEQNRAHWDWLLVERGLKALARAEKLGQDRSTYQLQAAIAACHARARRAEETDWARIAALYAELAQIAPSPIVELNGAVAIAMAFGPQAGLDLVDRLVAEPALRNYQFLPAVRGDLLEKLGRFDEACAEFERASELTRNAREQRLMRERAEQCSRSATRIH